MALLRGDNITVSYGGHAILDQASFAIEAGERVCLVGRNGAGKSTLFKILNGDLQPDDGQIVRRDGLRVARLVQAVPDASGRRILEVVADGLGEIGALISRYHALTAAMASGDTEDWSRLETVQQELEARDGWSMQQRVDTVLSRMGLEPDLEFGNLSGGMKRRVMLAQALVTEPDLLLLDEPTNHLDIETIGWLEDFLSGYAGTVLFITHDRALIRHLATRILDLDRGKLSSWPGNYAAYLRGKEQALHAESEQQARFDKKLQQEEAWIRQGIKARRTRNEGRVRALKAMRQAYRERRQVEGRADFTMQAAARSGRLVIEARDIGQRYDGKPLFDRFSTVVLRGDKVGIIGPNGCGKTTLLRILLGRLAPQSGEVRHGTRLEIAYADQLRSALDPSLSVMDNVSGGSENVTVDGVSRHVISYLQDFLFSPAQCRGPVTALSGGERNRLVLAALFCRPANLLVLDEPTNDLDMETLELLEARLVEYSGTVLLVSHDREFLDNVVTSSLVFEGQGRLREYVGGYSDWLRQRPEPTPPATVPAKPAAPPEKGAATGGGRTTRKLSYKDQRELDGLPDRIEALEAEQQKLSEQLADPAFYQQDVAEINAVTGRLADLERELDAAFDRWETLSSD
ncbi:ATP-binding cassette domain-containing protein [Methylonatrum kenyense]|uniref:ATP-binding cassette domain-containing protein n=1 Tax=Methylonatrum kenyense TaxID=455253 RepID=UPI0020C05D47|nr:ATP-binding cassette domain-containing protein [Methylonatrum kenyense]MCK8515597.1 ATP-binding cassette domain-containing protein [Methylonatrum kenyense]